MSGVCPNGPTHTVYRLKEYWEGRPKESEARKKLAPPQPPEAQHRLAAILIGAGVLLALTGGTGIALGLLPTIAGVGLLWVTRHRIQEALAAREQWDADYYCVTCPRQFAPK